MNIINKKYLLLIVEDELISIDILGERLLSEGFNVLKAFNGEEGLKLALENHPDLILLDLLMPKVDGLTMFKKLRADSWGKDAKVIILSNYIDSEIFNKSINNNISSVSGYMLKTDWSLDDIVSEVKNNLNLNNFFK